MKSDYTRDTFWSCRNEESGEVKFYMKVNNQMVEVSRDVYNVCFSSYAKSLRNNRKETGKLLSLDAINGENTSFLESIASSVNVEKEVLAKLVMQDCYSAISSLNEQEKQIIIGTILEGKSVRKLAHEMGIPIMTLQDKKKRALNKLKKILNNSVHN